MRLLWNYVNKKQMAPASKRATFVSIWTLINTIIGGALWFLIGRDFLPTIDWLICFAGYPAFFIGYIGGRTYLINHEFS